MVVAVPTVAPEEFLTVIFQPLSSLPVQWLIFLPLMHRSLWLVKFWLVRLLQLRVTGLATMLTGVYPDRPSSVIV